MTCCEQLDGERWNSLIDAVDTVMLDCDGVLWRSNDAIEGSPEAISYLRKKGKRVILVTNNSVKSRTSYMEKCKQLGFVIDGKENIITTSHLTADYLQRIKKFDGKVYIVGSAGLGHELDHVKIPHIGIGPDPLSPTNGGIDDDLDVKLDPEVKAVVVSFDRHISYLKLMKAASYLQDPECLFIATNDDAFECEATICPGAGSMVAAVTVASDRKPIILGKPNKPVFDFVKRQFNINPSKTLMIGDNIKTDMRLATNFGMRSLLVFSGVTSKGDLERKEFSSFLPEFFTNCLGDILVF